MQKTIDKRFGFWYIIRAPVEQGGNASKDREALKELKKVLDKADEL